MSPEERHRRAIATGLAPYLDSRQVPEAVALWQRDYAHRPRFSLQGYVSHISRLFEVGGRRHDLHLSLVQAMTLPDRELLPDPLGDEDGAHRAHPCTEAFQLLMRALWAQLDAGQAGQVRLDQLTDLRRPGVDPALRDTLEYWLNHADGDLAPLDQDQLRRLLNRAYVLLCERFGPVHSDRLLKLAVDRVRGQRPGLEAALHALL
jgi:hypothetical protein